MTKQDQTAPIAILRRPAVEAKTGLSRSSIYARMNSKSSRPYDYDPTFPKPIKTGARGVGWVEAEIDAWLNAQLEKRGKV